jgi:hypothetical protein
MPRKKAVTADSLVRDLIDCGDILELHIIKISKIEGPELEQAMNIIQLWRQIKTDVLIKLGRLSVSTPSKIQDPPP